MNWPSNTGNSHRMQHQTRPPFHILYGFSITRPWWRAVATNGVCHWDVHIPTIQIPVLAGLDMVMTYCYDASTASETRKCHIRVVIYKHYGWGGGWKWSAGPVEAQKRSSPVPCRLIGLRSLCKHIYIGSQLIRLPPIQGVIQEPKV